jgi:hypothetical protein
MCCKGTPTPAWTNHMILRPLVFVGGIWKPWLRSEKLRRTSRIDCDRPGSRLRIPPIIGGLAGRNCLTPEQDRYVLACLNVNVRPTSMSGDASSSFHNLTTAPFIPGFRRFQSLPQNVVVESLNYLCSNDRQDAKNRSLSR